MRSREDSSLTAPALEFIDVRKWFGPDSSKPAVDGLSLSVGPGEAVALVGPSGCGKTTALRLANRLLDADEGEIRVFGATVREQDPVALRRRIGYVIQEGGLFPHWTVQDNVETVPRLLDWPPAKRRERARQLLSLVGMPAEEFGSRRPRELSGGQRQRVGVARALAAEPALILMDEPFGALDPIARRSIQKEFRAWRERLTSAVLLVTHDLREAFRLADRVAVMQAGRVRQVGTREELTRRPADAFVREFVSEFES
ncbi:MAG TPA: ATP-binding cassette domain-containing protein [Thermoanaerobaculia bacterium]|jgi:osmoprotectant transport system ATP-binding protein